MIIAASQPERVSVVITNPTSNQSVILTFFIFPLPTNKGRVDETIAFPQLVQKRLPSGIGAPQDSQTWAVVPFPQLGQKLLPSGIGAPQPLQTRGVVSFPQLGQK